MTLQLKVKVLPPSPKSPQSGEQALMGKGLLPAGDFRPADALGLSPELDQVLAPLLRSAALNGLRLTVPAQAKFALRSSQGPAPLFPSGLPPVATLRTAQAVACAVGLGLLALLEAYPAACLAAVATLALHSLWDAPQAARPRQPAPLAAPGGYPLRRLPPPLRPALIPVLPETAPISDQDRLHLRLELLAPTPIVLSHGALPRFVGPVSLTAITLRSDRSPVLEGTVALLGTAISLTKLSDAAELIVPGLQHLLPRLPPISVSAAGAPTLTLAAGQLELLPGSTLHLTSGTSHPPADAPWEAPGRRLHLNGAGGAHTLLLRLSAPGSEALLGQATVAPIFNITQRGDGALGTMALGFSARAQGAALLQLLDGGSALLGADAERAVQASGSQGVEQHVSVRADAGQLLAQLFTPVGPT